MDQEDELLRAYDYSYPVSRLTGFFAGDMCPTLAGKPKIFLIQASRGGEIDRGVELSQNSMIECDGGMTYEPPSIYKIPAMADCLIMYSTAKGNKRIPNISKQQKYSIYFQGIARERINAVEACL